jgi:TetR/AcrR family transcriptional regulator, repressor for neighboring sulfatase
MYTTVYTSVIRYCTQMATSEATVLDTAKPIGKEEVIAAVLHAAGELFAEKGPAATSIREVATHAGVNHGLLHRHFGSKRQLLAATLQNLADSAAELSESGATPEQLEAAYERQARVMVRSTLDGFPVEELQQRFPGMEAFLEQVRAGHSDERTARLLAAHGMALQFGWGLLGPTLRVAFGLQDLDDTEIRAAIAAQIAKIVEPQ